MHNLSVKWVLFASEWKMISISKAEQLPLFWNRGAEELGNGLLQKKNNNNQKKLCGLLITRENRPHFATPQTVSPRNWLLGNERRNSEPLTCHYSDLVSVSDWLKKISPAARPIRSTTKIWVVTRHQYGISALVPQTLFRGETSGGIAKCQLFSQPCFLCVIV